MLRNVKSGDMPPEKKPQPTLAQRETLQKFVEEQVFPGTRAQVMVQIAQRTLELLREQLRAAG